LIIQKKGFVGIYVKVQLYVIPLAERLLIKLPSPFYSW